MLLRKFNISDLTWNCFVRKRLYLGCPIQCCVLSTVIAALLQLTVTLPMSLFVLIVHNWLLGRAMCYLLPMLQDLPSYVIMLSLLAISFERWRVILSRPMIRVNMNIVLPLIWLVSTIMVLPYKAFISHFYLDVSLKLLAKLQAGLENGQITFPCTRKLTIFMEISLK